MKRIFTSILILVIGVCGASAQSFISPEFLLDSIVDRISGLYITERRYTIEADGGYRYSEYENGKMSDKVAYDALGRLTLAESYFVDENGVRSLYKSEERFYSSLAEKMATSIGNVTANRVMESGAIYSLQGIRLGSVPHGSLYIKDGKKFLAK